MTDVDAPTRPLPGVRYVADGRHRPGGRRGAVRGHRGDRGQGRHPRQQRRDPARRADRDLRPGDVGARRPDPPDGHVPLQRHGDPIHARARRRRDRPGRVRGRAHRAAGRGPYSAAKAAMMSLSRVMAVEVADLGIRVNAVAPGWPARRSWSRASRTDRSGSTRCCPRSRCAGWPTTADIAAAVLFLASSDAAYITGQTLVVDGGWSILGMHDRPDWLRAAPRRRRSPGDLTRRCRRPSRHDRAAIAPRNSGIPSTPTSTRHSRPSIGASSVTAVMSPKSVMISDALVEDAVERRRRRSRGSRRSCRRASGCRPRRP